MAETGGKRLTEKQQLRLAQERANWEEIPEEEEEVGKKNTQDQSKAKFRPKPLDTVITSEEAEKLLEIPPVSHERPRGPRPPRPKQLNRSFYRRFTPKLPL